MVKHILFFLVLATGMCAHGASIKITPQRFQIVNMGTQSLVQKCIIDTSNGRLWCFGCLDGSSNVGSCDPDNIGWGMLQQTDLSQYPYNAATIHQANLAVQKLSAKSKRK